MNCNQKNSYDNKICILCGAINNIEINKNKPRSKNSLSPKIKSIIKENIINNETDDSNNKHSYMDLPMPYIPKEKPVILIPKNIIKTSNSCENINSENNIIYNNYKNNYPINITENNENKLYEISSYISRPHTSKNSENISRNILISSANNP